MDFYSDRIDLLVVHPDRQVVETISSCFSAERYHCVGVTGAAGALELLKQTPFSVVLCPLRLPGMTGVELLRRGLRRNPHAAFIMTADASDARLAAEALQLGAYECVQKPFQLEEIAGRVDRAVERQRAKLVEEIFNTLRKQALRERTEHLHRVLAQSRQAQSSQLEMLATALDTRESQQNMHSLRVQRFSVLLAERCGYPKDRLPQLAAGAILHDIGKIAVPSSILLKVGKLSDQEFHIMQHHARFGYQVLSRIPHFQEAAALALSHHERMDGKGYPMGLRGHAIPLEARIFMVADAMDVITAGRPYCAPRSLAQARAEISRCSGSQFDPEVVDVFLNIPGREWQTARAEVERRYKTLQPVFSKSSHDAGPLQKNAH